MGGFWSHFRSWVWEPWASPWGVRSQGAERAQERPPSKPREALAPSLCHPVLAADPLGPWPRPQALGPATGSLPASLVATLCPLEAGACREPFKCDPPAPTLDLTPL